MTSYVILYYTSFSFSLSSMHGTLKGTFEPWKIIKILFLVKKNWKIYPCTFHIYKLNSQMSKGLSQLQIKFHSINPSGTKTNSTWKESGSQKRSNRCIHIHIYFCSYKMAKNITNAVHLGVSNFQYEIAGKRASLILSKSRGI